VLPPSRGSTLRADWIRRTALAKSHARKPVQANSEDIKHLLGDLDDHVILDILALKPTIAELEESALRMEGEDDVLGGIRPASVTVAQIMELAAATEFEEPEMGHGAP
jgi:hypothetical protein